MNRAAIICLNLGKLGLQETNRMVRKASFQVTFASTYNELKYRCMRWTGVSSLFIKKLAMKFTIWFRLQIVCLKTTEITDSLESARSRT
jgi:hypothetical protein